ncbi:MAG TPA: aldo/keto reductase [Nitrososphaera sp.]|nr:aldo/keto reductase [Nitrososphaera sp.]
MLKRKFGWTGVEVPVLGQGTWMIEGSKQRGAEHEAIESLQLGLDLGLTHIDTAEMYGSGRAEQIVGSAIEDRREDVFLVSKVLPSNASYQGTIEACKKSLRRLKTEWLDLYLLHWPSSYPIADTMRAMEKLVNDGLIRFIGVSNFDLEELQEAERALTEHRIACNQVLYYLGNRGIERRLLPYCARQEIAIVGYSPFGHGSFPSPQSEEGRVLEEVAKRHGRTPRQVALNFLTRHPNTFSIPKARRAEHVKENSSSVGWSLTDADVAAIEKAFPLPRDDVPLEMI